MNDLQTINEIIGTAIEHSSYITVIISSCIFIVYTLIIQLVNYYKVKNRNNSLIEMANAVKEVSQNVIKLNGVLDKMLKDAEHKEVSKVKCLIEIVFNNLVYNVQRECDEIIIHNNIDLNKVSIQHNIKQLVSTEYYKLYNTLSAYQIDNINVASKLRLDWVDEITQECLSIIYNGQNNIDRIRQLSTKLEIFANEYSIYLNNKLFNN